MLTTSAYQVFSDTHLTTAARIIKTLCGGFPLACRQWGIFEEVNSGAYITLPLSSLPIQVVATDMAEDGDSLRLSTLSYAEGKFKVTGTRSDHQQSALWAHWIAVCK